MSPLGMMMPGQPGMMPGQPGMMPGQQMMGTLRTDCIGFV